MAVRFVRICSRILAVAEESGHTITNEVLLLFDLDTAVGVAVIGDLVAVAKPELIRLLVGLAVTDKTKLLLAEGTLLPPGAGFEFGMSPPWRLSRAPQRCIALSKRVCCHC